ncbi:MAG: aminotransferase class I/II-fold pyridoxal phosphate-dependent enzyme [Comamonadaceae bacterium]|nr:aminotransferase class I/II-fold pyridoxal phosphate-dependent enzyme [Comamonadaceae bacterium]
MISEKVQRIGASPTLKISAKAKAMKAEGIDVVDLSVGEPDFPSPENVKEAGIKAIRDNFTKYTASDGILNLRKAIAKRLKEDTGVEYAPKQIIVSAGAKSSLFHLVQALVDEGEEVIVPVPVLGHLPRVRRPGQGQGRHRPDARGGRLPADARGAQGLDLAGDEGDHPQQPLQSDRRRLHEGPAAGARGGRQGRGRLRHRRRDLRQPGLRQFQVHELRRARRGHQEEDRHRQRRVQVLLHDGLADRLRRRAGRGHRRHVQDPEPHDLQRLLHRPDGRARGLRRPPVRGRQDGLGVPAAPQLLPDAAGRGAGHVLLQAAGGVLPLPQREVLLRQGSQRGQDPQFLRPGLLPAQGSAGGDRAGRRVRQRRLHPAVLRDLDDQPREEHGPDRRGARQAQDREEGEARLPHEHRHAREEGRPGRNGGRRPDARRPRRRDGRPPGLRGPLRVERPHRRGRPPAPDQRRPPQRFLDRELPARRRGIRRQAPRRRLRRRRHRRPGAARLLSRGDADGRPRQHRPLRHPAQPGPRPGRGHRRPGGRVRRRRDRAGHVGRPRRERAHPRRAARDEEDGALLRAPGRPAVQAPLERRRLRRDRGGTGRGRQRRTQALHAHDGGRARPPAGPALRPEQVRERRRPEGRLPGRGVPAGRRLPARQGLALLLQGRQGGPRPARSGLARRAVRRGPAGRTCAGSSS